MTYALTVCLILLFLGMIIAFVNAGETTDHANSREHQHSPSWVALQWFLTLFVVCSFALNCWVLYKIAKETYVDSCGLAERP